MTREMDPQPSCRCESCESQTACPAHLRKRSLPRLLLDAARILQASPHGPTQKARDRRTTILWTFQLSMQQLTEVCNATMSTIGCGSQVGLGRPPAHTLLPTETTPLSPPQVGLGRPPAHTLLPAETTPLPPPQVGLGGPPAHTLLPAETTPLLSPHTHCMLPRMPEIRTVEASKL